jgi:glucose/arabinose dehydrogenase
MSTFGSASRRVAAVAALAVLAVGACSDDGGTASTSSPTSTTAATAAAGVSTTRGAAATTTVGTATTTPRASTVPLAEVRIRLELVATMREPIAIATRPGRSELWVAERGGRVRVLDPATGQVGDPIVDISSIITAGGERGLLGIAFSPDGSKLYLSYTDSGGNSRIDEALMRGDQVDTASRRRIIGVPQPFANHNGGNIAFGPDGHLWFGLGDGGSQNDPNDTGQDPNALLGSILRIAPATGDPAYTIPSDNPFAAGGGRPEIWLKGLRNPWRFSFDRATGDLWIGDVGGSRIEEIDLLPAPSRGRGGNLGWAQLEGSLRLKGAAPPGAIAPFYEYERSGGNCSVTGGYVYRGRAVPALAGTYVFGDYCLGELRLLRPGSPPQHANTGAVVAGKQLASFGEGPDGELYVLSLAGGVHRIVAG